ncbi:hypothetical protein PCK1_001632 [Pneumocystis canis]|nr:hypothetical protein PCK1_001632 [Pneumocystis canis]
MRVAFFALSAQIGCILAAVLHDGQRQNFDELERLNSFSAATYNGYRAGFGFLSDSKRLWQRRSLDLKGSFDEFSHGLGLTEEELKLKQVVPDLAARSSVDIDLGREGVQMLKKRDQEMLVEKIGEEELLALILKEKVDQNNCKKKLKEYCGSLKDAELTSEKVHKKLEDYCENDGKAKENKCNDLKDKIEKKCREFKEKLGKAVENIFIEKNCLEYEPQCHFLEGACIDVLKEECSKLRNQCYGLKRDKVAEEVLLRALKGGLKKPANQCEEKLKEKCKRLSGFSKELMQLCLHSEGTCKHLKEEAKKKCDSLEAELKKALEKDAKNLKNETCHPLLEQCHFYGPNCEEKDGLECEKLRTTCEEEHNIVYTPPEEPWFPIQPMPGITDKIGLEELYNEAAKLVRKTMGNLIKKNAKKHMKQNAASILKNYRETQIITAPT